MEDHKHTRIYHSWINIVFIAALTAGLIFGYIVSELRIGRQLGMLSNYTPSTPTKLYDRNGKVFAELYRHRQEIVPYNKIPAHVIQAFLAVEDDAFFRHFGLDFVGIARAAAVNIMRGQIVQGGSTLTQQLAKQIFLNAEGTRERHFDQKLRETILALQIEENMSKSEILEVYFNVIYLGHGCMGISCATNIYFNKNVEDLSLPEGAVLARLPRAPVNYSPFRNPTASRQAHKLVLSLMAENGFVPPDQVDSIHEKFWETYWAKVVTTSPSRSFRSNRENQAPYFTEYVRQILEASEEIGPDRLYTMGLRVYTTLDLTHQKIAEEEVAKALAEANRIGSSYAKGGRSMGVDTSLFGVMSQLSMILPVGAPEIQRLSPAAQLRKEIDKGGLLDAAELLSALVPAANESVALEFLRKDTQAYAENLSVQGAFISIEPRTGYITSMVGGTEFSIKNQFNRAVQARRQPGSAFKIFVYGAGFEQRRLSTATGLNDAPFFTMDDAGDSWSPGNYDEGFKGIVPLKGAFAGSLNTCAIDAYNKTGPDAVIDFASRIMKIPDRHRFHPGPSLALGSGEVTPLELATGVSIIANEGKDVIPFAVKYVTDQSGNVLLNTEQTVRKNLAAKAKDGTIQIIERGVAWLLKDIMKAVVNGGTATLGIRDKAGFRGEAAAKTGTTSSWSDAWIAGFNPEITTVYWVGYDRSSITLGAGQAGGHIASPVMGYFLKRLYQESGRTPPSFPDSNGEKPDTIVSGPCGGLGMAPGLVHGEMKKMPPGDVCAGADSRIYDQRELLMKELGITPEELGADGKVKFKN